MINIKNNILSFSKWNNITNFHHGVTTKQFMPETGKKDFSSRVEIIRERNCLPNLPIYAGVQTHGDNIAIIRNEIMTENKINFYAPINTYEIDCTDAIISLIPNTIITIRTADCQSVFFVDAKNRFSAIAHCGWKGVMNELAVKTAKKLIEYGSQPEDIEVWFGPSISAPNYEVSQTLLDEFQNKFPYAECSIDNRKLDLNSITSWQLKNIGIKKIFLSQECTFANSELYHSYRRDGVDAGRQISFAYFN